MPAERTVLMRLKADVGDFVRGMTTARAAMVGFADDIDKTNDRTAWMAQGLLAIGPALAPIGAAAVPAIAGLAMQMGLAAAAAGTALYAFNGIGDGLKALNDYQLQPTAENMAKVRLEFEKLGPAGVEMVTYLDSISGRLSTLQDAAREGMFPGVEQGIDSMLTMLPRVRTIIGEIAEGMGQLAAEGGSGLAGAGFADFFEYLDNNAKPLLIDMGRTIGNFVQGLAQMAVEFGPLTNDFSEGFLNMSRDFAQWTAGLDQNRSFQNFIAYVHDSMPMVGDFIGSVVDALVSLVKAAAPIGDVMLPVLTKMLDIISELADTPLGPTFFALGAAISVYGRASALADVTTGSLFKHLSGFQSMKSGVTSAFTGMAGPVREWGAAVKSAGADSEHSMGLVKAFNDEARAQKGTFRTLSGSVGTFARQVGPAVGAAGALAFAMSDLDEKAGLTNTAMLGLMGSMAGPWGAAAGVMIGAAMDAAAANNDFYASMRHLDDLLKSSPLSFDQQSDALKQMGDDVAAFTSSITDDSDLLNTLKSFKPAALKNTFEGWFGDSDIEEMQAAQDKREQLVEDYQRSWSDLVNGMNGTMMSNGVGRVDWTKDLKGLEASATSLQPAMEALGLTMDNMGTAGSAGWRDNVEAIKAWMDNAESAAGRTDNVKTALAGLDDITKSTAQSADTLAAALASLFGPGLDAEAAMDAYIVALRDMGKALDDNEAGFRGNSKAAIENRDSTRTAFESINALLVARAKNGASAQQIATQLARSREAFIQEGVAAGKSREQMVARANAMGLTPKLVRTVFEAVGLDYQAAKIKGLVGQINRLPKAVRTKLEAEGYELTSKQITALKKKYDLTPAEVRTLIQAKDNASKIIAEIQRRADAMAQRRYEAKLDANGNPARSVIANVNGLLTAVGNRVANATVGVTGNALGEISAIQAHLSQLNGYTARTYIMTTHVSDAGGRAEGGPVYGPGTATSDSILTALSNGEFVVKTAAVNHYGLDFMYALNAQRLASGGVAGTAAVAGPAPAANPLRPEGFSVATKGVTVAFNGPITTLDAKSLARETAQRQRDALALANQP